MAWIQLFCFLFFSWRGGRNILRLISIHERERFCVIEAFIQSHPPHLDMFCFSERSQCRYFHPCRWCVHNVCISCFPAIFTNIKFLSLNTKILRFLFTPQKKKKTAQKEEKEAQKKNAFLVSRVAFSCSKGKASFGKLLESLKAAARINTNS